MVDGVVVGHVQVRDAMLPQHRKHCGVGPEHKALVERRLLLGDRTLDVGHHNVGRGKQRVDRLREKTVGTAMAYQPPHVAAEHHVAREKHDKRVCTGHGGTATATVSGAYSMPLGPGEAMVAASLRRFATEAHGHQCGHKQPNTLDAHGFSTPNCRK